MTDAWWYEKGRQPAGPVPFATLQRLTATGEVKPSTLVWAEGMAGWARAETVALLSFPGPPPLQTTPVSPPPLDTTPVAPPPSTEGTPPPSAEVAPPPSTEGTPPPSAEAATPPPAPEVPPPAGPVAPMNWLPKPRAATAAGAVAEPAELNVATVLLLSVVTFGIYGAIQFYQSVRAYERLAGRETRFALYFWLFVGCSVGASIVHVLLPFLGVAALAFEFLALSEALRARRDAMAIWQLTPEVTSANTHWLYLGLGTLLAPILVGFVFLLLQAKKWFEDWNAIRAAAVARG